MRDHVAIYGTDFPTEDGTGIRDYIHIEDLAAAHTMALGYMDDGGTAEILNCGYGHGYSVREVLDTVERISRTPFPTREEARRKGDPAMLISAAEKISKVLGWNPRYDDLDVIVESALRWEQELLRRRTQN